MRSRLKKAVFVPTRREATSALVVCVLGVFLLLSPLGDSFVQLSFDIPSLFNRAVPKSDIAVIKFDESTLSDTNVNRGTESREPALPRSAYARLLKKLAADGARLVIFDVVLKGEMTNIVNLGDGEMTEDQALASELEKYGKAILAADLEVVTGELAGVSVVQPDPIFRKFPSYRFGLIGLDPEHYSDHVVREFPIGLTNAPILSVVAAQALGMHVVPPSLEHPRFIGYYGGSNALRAERFQDALERASGYFTNKIVFVGSNVKTEFPGTKLDLFYTPFTRWTHLQMRGVDIHATMLLNLLNDESLSRWGVWKEFFLLLVTGLAAGIFFGRLTPGRALAWAAGLALAVSAAAILIFWLCRVWFDWMLIPAVQIPAAWAASAIPWGRRPLPVSAPEEYEFLEQVGAGAFGEVWLARNTPTGAFRAIKRVYRDRFSEQRPYEREFEGLKNFELSGLVHPGWVRVLHVSKNDSAGYFYYAMEPADDLATGSDIQPGNYTPKTLGRVLVERGWLPVSECISIGIQIADALAALHKMGMVHRDVKPSNIIFVRGTPKLADIGLVASADARLSVAGTKGFAPDTELGTPAADICCLGRTLYQAATGYPPEKYPSLPTGIDKRADARELMHLMDVIIRACEIAGKERYHSAEELRDDLMRLQIW